MDLSENTKITNKLFVQYIVDNVINKVDINKLKNYIKDCEKYIKHYFL